VNRFRGNAWIEASFDQKTKTMLWEACLGSTMALSEESSQVGKKHEPPRGLQSVPEKGSSTTCL
jgi:hypothetical protein